MMDGRGRTFLLLQLSFCFFIFASTEETKQNCSQVECPGPLSYYHEMGCTPAYRNQGDCCAYKYNCDHLDARSLNKCYVNNRSYEIGELVNPENSYSCHYRCICGSSRKSTRLWCFRIDYDYRPRINSNCYLKRNIHECGPGTITCPKNESEVPWCVYQWTRMRAGQLFSPYDEPWKLCICQEGYTGDNIEPFCVTPSTMCFPLFFNSKAIANKHAPVYDLHKNVTTSCPVILRRQHSNDTVIPNPNKSATPEGNHSGENEDLTCKIGNLTMNIGDQLSPYTFFGVRSVNCTCEVPPTPTCKLVID